MSLWRFWVELKVVFTVIVITRRRHHHRLLRRLRHRRHHIKVPILVHHGHLVQPPHPVGAQLNAHKLPVPQLDVRLRPALEGPFREWDVQVPQMLYSLTIFAGAFECKKKCL